MDFFTIFFKKLVFAIIFIVLNFALIFIISFLIVNKREDFIVNDDKSITIVSKEQVINFRDFLIGAFIVGMVIYMVVQVLLFVADYTNYFMA